MRETVQGQVDEIWIDTSEPADVVTLADSEAVKKMAMRDASARGCFYANDPGDSHCPSLQ